MKTKILIPNIKDEKYFPFYKEIRNICDIGIKKGVISNIIVHGSYGDYTNNNFSDLDIVVIMTTDNITLEKKFIKQFINPFLLQNDPLQHHGAFILRKKDINNYNENYLPMDIYKKSWAVYEQKIYFNIKNSKNDFLKYNNTLDNIKSLFKLSKSTKNIFFIKRYISNILMLPAFYCSGTGRFCHKADSFDHFFMNISNDQKKAIQLASEIRDKWRKIKCNKYITKFLFLGQTDLTKSAERLGCFYSLLNRSWIKNLLKDIEIIQSKIDLFDKIDDGMYNLPVYVSLKAYNKEIEKYVNNAKKNDDVLAIYQFGSIKSFGISDIDIIVITKNIVRSNKHLSVRSMCCDKNLFLHEVFIINEELFEQLHYIIYVSAIKLLWKKDNYIEKINNEITSPELSYLINIDFVSSRLIEFELANAIDIRHWLTKISSIKHTVKLLKIKSDFSNVDNGLLEQIESVRNKVSNNERIDIDEFKVLFRETHIAFQQIFNELLAIVPITGKDNMYKKKLCFGNLIYLSSDENIKVTQRDISLFKRSAKYIFIKVPKEYLSHIMGYIGDSEESNKYRKEQQKRVAVVKQHNNFLIRNKLIFSMKGYLGGVIINKKKGFRSWLRDQYVYMFKNK